MSSLLTPADSIEKGYQAAQFLERHRLQREVQDAEYRLWALLIGLVIGLLIVGIHRLVVRARRDPDGER